MSKVSIITATWNSAATVGDTLRSIAEQDHGDTEHLIIDGGSRDNTLEIARSFPHVAWIQSEPDRGLYDAMNKGIARASGDIIGILNSDDFYVHGAVLSRVAALMDATGAPLLYADLEYVHQADPSRVLRRWKAGPYAHGRFLNGWMPPHPTLFVRREVYAAYGGFNLSLRFSADYELMLRLLHRYRLGCAYLPEVTVRMRAGGMSNANLRNRLKANREDRLAWKINGLRPRFYTIPLKPLSKVGQFLSF